ncbi:mismatch-specific DNA-glycosylase [Bradyrhizobium sp. BWA-3-5]|uniref:mismatch-specific DNA-glycosylase n=1 Tax=Bradyrhizobium sp. BWA-3-5 TaxID=3080013 RepID=UPI00293F0C9C|nr:mismatch-specific DNA-glycosylase [Bradyrhizobium sp. BWA-3-5]WOH66852.1 mismatch-specific DNA-glycosylase [Bradyrhizobium sp. BWA-3-5]
MTSDFVTDVLSDLLQHSLRIVLCGTAAGTTSAAERAYYAHPQNKFWRILHETRLTPEQLQPRQYHSLLQHGIGLTDLVKIAAGMDRATLPKLSAADRARLSRAVTTFRPRFLAFTSKTAGQKFFGGTRDYGEQRERLGDTRVWILPSTSGAANGSWQPGVWHRFAEAVRAAGTPSPLRTQGPITTNPYGEE